MKVVKTNLEGVLLLIPGIFEDHRGHCIETYNKEEYENICNVEFVQDDVVFSARNVLRGIHTDDRTWKLVSCIWGRIYSVVVNCDESSNEFGKWQSFAVSDRTRHQILIPPRHGNGYVVMSENAIVQYKQSTYYDRKSHRTYKWDDSNLSIWWPIDNPILSERDSSYV